ncbi:MAG: Hvo_1808 family surface protein, partial [Halobacteriaceae archaeon]
PIIKRGTLVHELVHALQDQYVGLYSKQFFAQTQDESLAIDGIIEGEANYIQYLYAQRCGEEWSCVDPPKRSDNGDNDSTTQFNAGIFVTIFHPYSDGPVYIHWLVQQNGWSAVNNAYKNPPETTEQIIHTTNESQAPISFQNRSQNGWRMFPKQGKNGWDSVGEASIFAMFWYQSRQMNASLIDGRNFTAVKHPYDTYNYISDPSMGWANDMIVPYHKQGQYGYVWITKWDTQEDATEFKTTYIAMLNAHQADRIADQLWVIPNGSFADTFKIIHTNQTVIIVNGPDQEAVANIYPESPSNVETDQPTTASPTESFGQSGFGIIIAMIAFLIVIIHSIRKNR